MSASGESRADVVAAVRAFVLGELVRDPGRALADDEPLLASGLVSSFDLVAIAVFLERRFGLALPDAALARERLDTLGAVADLVAEHRALAGREPGQAPGPDPIARGLPSFRRAPLAAGLGIALALLAVELAVRARFASPGAAAAWAGVSSRRLDLDFPDYEAALAHHDLVLAPPAAGERRVLFLGDSGPWGAFAEAGEACPAVLGERLAAAGLRARVANLAAQGQCLAKDAAILEAAQPRAGDVVVVSLGGELLDRAEQAAVLGRLPALARSRRLFERFLASSGAGARPELVALAADLAVRGRARGFELDEGLGWLGRGSALARDRLFLQRGLRERLKRALGIAPARDVPRRYRGEGARDLPPPRPFELDPAALAVLEAIVVRVRGAGGTPVFFLEPVLRIPGDPARRVPWDEPGWRALDATLADVSRRLSVPVVDGRSVVGPGDFLDTNHHWSVEAHNALGELLARELASVLR